MRRLEQPAVRTGHVAGAAIARHRCLDILARSGRPIHWIAAPAGTGKSHLLRQISDRDPQHHVLLPVDAGDADPSRFLDHLARVAGPLVAAPCPFTEVRPLLDHMAERSTLPVRFVFDDMHRLDPASKAIELLTIAVDGLSDRLSFTFASREASPASWAGFLADGRMERFGPELLFMDAEEIGRLLLAQGRWVHGTDPGLVTELLSASHGWASGLAVLIRAAQMRPGNGVPFGRQEARDLVLESFSDQVLSTLRAAERRRLMLIAPCRVLSPELLRPVPETLRLLERLARNNTMVCKEYPHAMASAPRYRLHSLFRECLLHEAQLELPRRETRRAAARMVRQLLAMGEDEAARDLLVETEDWHGLARHLEEKAPVLDRAGRTHSLAPFLEALPVSVRDKSLALIYWYGLCKMHHDPSGSRIALARAYEGFRARGEHANAVRAWGGLVDAIWFEWEDCARLDPCIEAVPHLASLADEADTPELCAIVTKGAFAALSIRCPEHPDFESWEARNLELFQRRLPRSETIRRGLQLMIHYVYGAGDRRKAEIVRARLRQIYEKDAQSAADHCVYHVVNAAFQFWFDSDPTQAPGTVITGLAATERLGLPFWDVPMLNAAMFRLASDETLDGLRNMLALLDERLSPDSREHDIAISQHFAAYLAWLEGDHEKALIAIDAACRIAVASGFCISPVYYGVGRAAVLDSLGRRREALAQLTRARHSAVRQRSRAMLFMALMVGAGMALRAGRRSRVLAFLKPALEMGGHERYRATPWLRREERGRLCGLAMEMGIAPDFAHALGAKEGGTFGSARAGIRTLGHADILRHGRSELTSRKPQAMPLLLMLHLVAAGESGRSPEQLVDALWPEADSETGRDRLKTTLYRLRKLLGDGQAIASAGGRLRLRASLVDVDAWTIERLIEAKGETVEIAERVVDLYDGAFADLYSGHTNLVLYREHLAQKVEHVVLVAGASLMNAGTWDRATALFEGGLERFGYHEEFLDRLRECLARAGRTEALKRLQDCWSEEAADMRENGSC